MTRRVLIVGSGKRVREAAVPALQRLAATHELAGVFARTEKRLEVGGVDYGVRKLDDLTADEVAAAELVYVAVGKPNVPAVLRQLTRFDVSRLDVLIETPVVLFKHFHHAALLRAFRKAWVAEDCVELPCHDAVRAALDAGALGEPRHALFFQSVYDYHGVAIAKHWLGSGVRRARRVRLGPHVAVRTLQLAGGKSATVYEPRDYAAGRLLLVGTKGSLSDYVHGAKHNVLLEPVLEPAPGGARCVGFRAGDAFARLDDDEAALMEGADPAAGVTARMDDMKRVGFLRLLRRIADGRGAYPVDEALDDMLVDYALHKVGRYVATPLSSARSGLGRAALGGAMRALGR